jgi:small subunit ribosomal protein S8
VSKPGQRIYVKAQEIPRVLNGLGLAIVSTPKGVMSGDEARKQKLGGEYLCEIY